MAYIGNTPGRTTVIQLEARKSFSLGLWFMDQGGRPADLTGSNVRLVAKASPIDVTDTDDSDNLIVSSTATIVDAEHGYCTFDLQASELDLEPTEYPFAIVLTTPTGYTSTVLKGVIDIQQNPDFTAMMSSYLPPEELPSQTLEVVLRGISLIDVRLGHVPPPGFHWLSAADQDKIDQISMAATVMPVGGIPGQVLGKISETNYDYRWVTLQAYDGTLNAAGIPAGRAPVSDGADSWNWGEVSPTVDWSLPEGDPGSVLNKPTLGTASTRDDAYFSQPGHEHAAEDVTSGLLNNARVPRMAELRGFSYGAAEPSGGVDGDIYFQILEP